VAAPAVYRRGKAIFRAPLDSFHIEPEPAFVSQLLSEESLRHTGYFDVSAVRHWRSSFRRMRPGSLPRLSVEMGLVAVLATQLWHHLYIEGTAGGPAHFNEGHGEEPKMKMALRDSRTKRSSKFRQGFWPRRFCLRVILFDFRHFQPLLDQARASAVRPIWA
jgi:hypothetical protein